MSFIEGIGDEVTVIASILVVATTLLVAWLSTFVSDRPGVRTASPSDASATGDEPRIDADVGTENQRTDEADFSSPTETTPDTSQATQERPQVADTDSGSVPHEDRTSLEETEIRRIEESSESQGVSESLPSCVVRNKLTAQTNPPIDEPNSQGIQTSTNSLQNDSNQSADATKTAVDGDSHSERVLDGIPSNSQDTNQSEEPTQEEQAAEGSVCIRIKYLTDRERVVYTNPTETLGSFRRRTFAEEISSGQTVRLIFNGHLLQDDNSSLSDLNVNHNCVIHCLLSQNATPSDARLDVQEADVDLGRFMIPLFACILGFVWYLRWQYRYMFNATSTLSLVGVTTLFVLAVLASWRG